ncbi:MAG: hypothetical protein V3S08_01195, partial [Phycisphaerales bacterium]
MNAALSARLFIDRHFARTIDDDRLLGIRVDDTNTMVSALKLVMDAAMQRFPSDDASWTIAVDVIGFSMGFGPRCPSRMIGVVGWTIPQCI